MVEWFEDSAAAIAAAKQHKGIFVAFVHDDSEASKGMQEAWESPVIDSVVSASPHIFCVKFAASSPMCNHFLSAFPQATPPCTLVFDTVKRKTRVVLRAPSTPEVMLDTLTSGCQREEEVEEEQGAATSASADDAQQAPAPQEGGDTESKDDEGGDGATATLEERKEAMLAKMARAKEQKRQAELEEEKRRETARREQAKAMQSAQRRFEEEQMKRIGAEKRKERIAEKKRRQEILQKIQQDRERKKQQQQQQQQQEEGEGKPGAGKQNAGASGTDKAAVKQQQRVPPSVDGYTQAVLSLRLPDGNTEQATFSADAEMREVFAHVRSNLLPTNNPIAIRQPYPVKTFEENDETTLRALGLVPRARLLVQVLEQPPKPPSMCEWLWELVASFFRGPSAQQSSSSSSSSSTSSSRTSRSSPSSSREEARRRRRRRVGRPGDDDEDGRDAYNGNSTQFQF